MYKAIHYGLNLTFALALVLQGSCLENSDESEPPSSTCIPDKTAWEQNAREAFETNCGLCHGTTPNYSAPYSLLDYDFLIAGSPGERPVDKIISTLIAGVMPPAPYPGPNHTDYDTMLLWASCGLAHPDYQAGLTANRDVFLPSEPPPEDALVWDILASSFEVKPTWTNHYECFMFDVPIDEPHLAKRFETIIDEGRVLHHIVLYRDTDHSYDDRTSFKCTGTPGDSDFLYAWAPGQGPLQFPDGGLLMEPGERYILQIHYNNAAGITDVRDQSGVRIHYSQPKPDDAVYSMFVPGPNLFFVPPMSGLSVTGKCKIREDTTLFTGMPHMHEIGQEFHSEVMHEDGTVENIIDLTGWSFEAQLFYDFRVPLKAGDEVRTTCVFFNDNQSRIVIFGPHTDNEMCFNFAYVTPPIPNRFCNDSQEFESF